MSHLAFAFAFAFAILLRVLAAIGGAATKPKVDDDDDDEVTMLGPVATSASDPLLHAGLSSLNEASTGRQINKHCECADIPLDMLN